MKILTSILFALMISLALVSAFGVSSPYWVGNPMIAYPGMTSEVSLNLQNIANPTGDVIAVMKVVQGSEIASLTRSEYEVKQGSTTDVPLRIKIPSDAAIGSNYRVVVDLKTKGGSTDGMVGLATGMVVGFDIIVQEKPISAETNKTAWYLGVAIAVVLLIIIVAALRRRNK
ncbi:MAG: hypothetical protein QXS38_01350 [Candidatus Pacearchaeota archaeon]